MQRAQSSLHQRIVELAPKDNGRQPISAKRSNTGPAFAGRQTMERNMRRATLAGLTMVAAVMFGTSIADAQVSTSKNPWCIVDGAMGAGSWDCSYYNLKQCQASASGAGGSCSRNPNYRGGRQTNQRNQQPYQGGTWGWGGQR